MYDAVGRPVGNVTEIDTARDILQVDGRPQGFDTYEIPLSMVDRTGDTGSNEIHLDKVIDTNGSGGVPRFMDPPARPAPSSTATASAVRSRPRSRTEPAMTTPTTSTRARTTEATTDPAGTDTMREFTPPYASRHPTMGPEGQTPSWGDEDDGGWSASKIAMGGLALGGLAVATYFMRRRMRRKTAFEQFMDMASDYFDHAGDYVDTASEFARNRHPAWWASLAAAALPVAAYYAWPSSKPTYTEQARDRADDWASYVAGLAASAPWRSDSGARMADRVRRQMPGSMPSMPDFEMPSNWHMPKSMPWGSSDRSSAWDWSPRPDVAGTLGALAVGALAVYLIRRATEKPSKTTRDRKSVV